MFSAARSVIESNIPAAKPITQKDFGSPKALNPKRRREQEDITNWLELQEEAELDLVMSEIVGRNRASARRYSHADY